MASVDTKVALLGYGTVGAAVDRLLTESADDIERATGHRLRVVKALVRDVGKEREHRPSGVVLTDDFGEIVEDPEIAVVAEVDRGQPVLDEYRRKLAETQIEQVGARLRALNVREEAAEVHGVG